MLLKKNSLNWRKTTLSRNIIALHMAPDQNSNPVKNFLTQKIDSTVGTSLKASQPKYPPESEEGQNGSGGVKGSL